jgi:hypothetical protein
MRRLLPVVCLLFIPALAGADVWDVQSQNDNTSATKNELVHGSDQLHDLAFVPGIGSVPDQDWYQISQKPRSSYEIVVDATSGDLGAALKLERRPDTGGAALQTSVAVGIGYSRSLRFQNTTTLPVNDQRVLVESGSCTTNCGADDVYRIRAYDTTYAIARFNNNASQTTTLILQNPTNESVAATVYLWSSAGTLIAQVTVSPAMLTPKSVYVLNTATVAGGQSGSITISNEAPYARLSGKAVALEPATGFSFDTQLMPASH